MEPSEDTKTNITRRNKQCNMRLIQTNENNKRVSFIPPWQREQKEQEGEQNKNNSDHGSK